MDREMTTLAAPGIIPFDPLSIVSAFFLHIGARHIQFQFTEAQKRLIAHPATQVLILTAMFYITTRSILWSLVLISVYFLLLYMLLNENHPLNVLSRTWLQKEGFLRGFLEDKSPLELYYENIQTLP